MERGTIDPIDIESDSSDTPTDRIGADLVHETDLKEDRKTDDESETASIIVDDEERQKRKLNDVTAFSYGVGWLVAFTMLYLFLGYVDNWNVDNNTIQLQTVVNSDRFEQSKPNEMSPHRYFWIAKDKASNEIHLFVWFLYIFHQLSIWLIQYKTEDCTPEIQPYLRWFNYYALAIHGSMFIIHLAMDHLFYDTIARDVHESAMWSCFGFFVILCSAIEYENRGILFQMKILDFNHAIRIVKKYHSYLFNFIYILCFHYSPMETTFSHTVGFFYVGLLMLDGSMMYTEVHENRTLRLTLEYGILFMLLNMAFQMSDADLLTVYFYGTLILFASTQVFSLPYFENINHEENKKHKLFKFVPVLTLLVLILFGYATNFFAISTNFGIFMIPFAHTIGLVMFMTMINVATKFCTLKKRFVVPLIVYALWLFISIHLEVNNKPNQDVDVMNIAFLFIDIILGSLGLAAIMVE